VEKQQIPILKSLVLPDRGLNPGSTTLEVSMLTITPQMWFGNCKIVSNNAEGEEEGEARNVNNVRNNPMFIHVQFRFNGVDCQHYDWLILKKYQSTYSNYQTNNANKNKNQL
jgi:hypothetical protein